MLRSFRCFPGSLRFRALCALNSRGLVPSNRTYPTQVTSSAANRLAKPCGCSTPLNPELLHPEPQTMNTQRHEACSPKASKSEAVRIPSLLRPYYPYRKHTRFRDPKGCNRFGLVGFGPRGGRVPSSFPCTFKRGFWFTGIALFRLSRAGFG